MKLFVARLIAFAGLVLSAALLHGTPVALAANQCDTRWANPVDGFWGDNSKWDNGVPNGNGACLDVDGTYTVTVGVTPPNVSYLIVDNNNGSVTLQIDGGPNGTSLSMQGGVGGNVSRIGVDDRLVLTNLTATNGPAVFHAPTGPDFNAGHITNNGTIDVIDGSAGASAQRYLTGNILNNGTINIHRSTIMDTSQTIWQNNATLDLGAGDTLKFADTGCGGCRPTFVNGGQITGSGFFLVDKITHDTNGFFQGNGSIASTAKVILNSSSLHYIGNGHGRIIVRGDNNQISGNMVAGQQLVIEAVDNGSPIDARIFSNDSWSSAGTIVLTHGGTGVGGAAIFEATKFGAVFTNTGSIVSQTGTGGTSSTRHIWGNIVSSGTITIARDTAVDRNTSVWTNTGKVTILAGSTLSFPTTGCGACDPTFANAGGSIGGGGMLAMDGVHGSTNGFFQGDGVIAPAATVILHNSALHYTGNGASKIVVRGGTNELSGNIAAKQELIIQGTHLSPAPAEDARIVADEDITSAGIVRLSHAGSGSAGNSTFEATIFANQTFTNNGQIISEDGVGGSASTRKIWGYIANKGYITINRSTTVDRHHSSWTSTAYVTIAAGKMLSFKTAACGGCDPTFANNGGKILGGGTLLVDEIHHSTNGYFQGAGRVDPAVSVVLHNSSLHFTAAGAARVIVRGPNNDLTGNIATTQELVIQRVGAEDAFINADSPLLNGGTITLAAGSGNATLRVNFSNLLNNAGTLRGTGTVIAGTLRNAGRVVPGNGNAPGVINVSANYQQTGTGKLLVDIGGATKGTQYDNLAITGAASLSGQLVITMINSFAPNLGDTFTILNHASRAGTFSSVAGANVNGMHYAPAYSATQTDLTVASGTVSRHNRHDGHKR